MAAHPSSCPLPWLKGSSLTYLNTPLAPPSRPPTIGGPLFSSYNARYPMPQTMNPLNQTKPLTAVSNDTVLSAHNATNMYYAYTLPGVARMIFITSVSCTANMRRLHDAPGRSPPGSALAVPTCTVWPAKDSKRPAHGCYAYIITSSRLSLIRPPQYIPSDHYTNMTAQFQWLEEELKKIDRHSTPWVVLHM